MAPGPASSDRLVRQSQDIIDRASKSFATASRLFPAATRCDVMLLYTWCRHCDDLTDGQQLGRGTIRTASSATLAKLRADSLAALAGQPTAELPFQALADLSKRHTISRSLVEAHIRGFELDVEGWQPKTLDDTMKYCYHTAGTVGMMMASIMDVDDGPTFQRASDLGIAFQLTNIARDVREDAMAGRSYLPEEWRVEAGLDIADLAHSRRAEQVFPLVKRLAEEAEPYYDSAAIGIRALPRRAAWAIATARAVYRDIGHQIMRRGPDALRERVFTSKARKTWLMISAAPEALAPRHTPVASGSRAGLWTPPEIA
jgi:phytoene synthase